MGSSAGGYCSVLLTEAVLADPNLPKPVALMTLYGELNIASSHYNRPKKGSERVQLRPSASAVDGGEDGFE